jgi:hypothetical protein
MGFMLSMVLALAAFTQAGATNSPHLPAMADLSPVSDTAQYCSAETGLCLTILNGDEDASSAPQLEFSGPNPDGGADQSTTLPLPLDPEFRQSLSLWPHVIRLPGDPEDAEGNQSMLVGILVNQSTMYSGGGGSAQRLHLIRLRFGVGTPRLDDGELLSVPWSASLIIRACFAEEDSDLRQGACHDEYRYNADLILARSARQKGELPELVYRTEATAFPKPARRDQDSNTLPPLRESDLNTLRDPECSYTRRLDYNPATERYEMDRPAPDCSSYTVP